ncbi:Cu(I)/Ag(I) efflux system membrane protein [Candidatus Brocadia sinica JPN1]|uniref:Cu(I)/Ag(I) efflux system membrane protein n=2 Tax=Candidatus Brocadia TaxID=380240 RepID=A0ABQ0JST5_9BACT|nr:Cu(I)/Ag(I) efflux system membrane protein [Candidatus Brocadia sinica JPN1]
MHPSVKMDKPGKCPICAMELVPVYEKGLDVEEEGALATIELSERARKLAQVRTDAVGFRSLTKDIYTVGIIEYDERLKAFVSAWIPGRIDKLFVDFTGTEVVKGESMVWIYSPELVSTQEEYLLALETYEKVKESPFDEVIHGAKSLVDASERRLLWWGVTEKQIEELTKDKKVKQHTIIYAPISGIVIEKKALEGQYVMQGEMIYTVADLSNVWMMANIYEYEMAWIKVGQEVEVTTPTYPGEAFIGRIAFIEPFLDDKTRSVKIRCDIPNQQLKLKPSMYVNARIRIPVEELEKESGRYVSGLDYFCPNHPEIKSSRPGICPEDNIPFVKNPPAQIELVAASSTISPQGEIEYEYACPMGCHSAKEPGNCPKCGMKLEKRPVYKEAGYEYICPMKCYSSKEPGDCPVCKMKLEKVPISKKPEMAVKTETVYVCPMECHTSKTSGNCPVCGMRLEKKEIPAEVSGENLTCICPQEWDPATAPKACPMCGMLLQKSVTITLPTGEEKQKFVYMCPMACMTSDKPGECPDCKRQMGRWEVREDLGIKTKKIEPKRRSVYACPMHPEVVSDKPGNCNKCGMNLEKTTQVLAIPATAVLDTGIRKIIYIDKGNGQYVGKEVVLGPKAGDYYPVLEGLEEGDKVVTSANFLIDSQSQLTGGASALYGGAMEFKEEK